MQDTVFNHLLPFVEGLSPLELRKFLLNCRLMSWPVVRHASVCVLTFIVNIFSKTTCPTVMKFHRNVPLQNLWKEFNSLKNSGCYSNKT